MPESSFEFMSNRLYQPGVFGPFEVALDDDITDVVITIDRSTWDEPDPDPLLSWELWRSEDDGVTWLYAGYSSTHGGVIVDDEVGLPIQEAKWSMSWPPGVNRWVRALITVHRRTRLQAVVDFIIR